MKQTAKEKAIELVDKMYETSISTVPVTRGEAKKLAKISINETIIMLQYANKMNCQWQDPDSGVVIPDHEKSIECALIAVNELIENTHMYIGNLNPKWVYWNDVKKILEEL